MFGMVFNKLRQLVTVFLDWDLEGVLDPSTKTAKYGLLVCGVVEFRRAAAG